MLRMEKSPRLTPSRYQLFMFMGYQLQMGRYKQQHQIGHRNLYSCLYPVLEYYINLHGRTQLLCEYTPFGLVTHSEYRPIYLLQHTYILSLMYKGYKVHTNTNKSLSSIQTKRGLGETRVESLQKEIDTFTRKIEQQKRKLTSAQETYNNALKDYQDEKSKLDQLKKDNATGEICTLQSKVKSLEGTLDKAVSVYDQTLSGNTKLKEQIDRLRREKKNYKEIQKNLQQQIRRADDQASRKAQAIESKKQRTESLKNEIVSVRMKNQQEKSSCMRQFQSLQRNYLEEKRIREAAKLSQKAQRVEIIDTQPLLKMRLKKLTAKNAEKVATIADYQKNIKRIQLAFQEIKKSSGVDDLQEITNNFIKSEEQNYSLYNYVDTLTQNVAALDDQYKDLQVRIGEQQTENERRKSDLTLAPEQRPEKYTLDLKLQQQKAVQLTKFVEAVAPDLQRVLIALAKSRYNDDTQKLHDYQISGFQINQRNIEDYLSDLEKYINILIEQKSGVQGESQVPSRPLPTKDKQSTMADRHTSAPMNLEDGREERDIMGESDLKKFAQEFVDKKKHR